MSDSINNMSTQNRIGDAKPQQEQEPTNTDNGTTPDRPERADADNLHDGCDGEKPDAASGTFEPINCTASNAQRPGGLQAYRTKSGRSRSLERSWSLSDGYSSHGREREQEGEERRREEEGLAYEEEEEGERSRFTVTWDDKDPMNPRNMNKLRRWVIVLIVSMGSLCV